MQDTVQIADDRVASSSKTLKRTCKALD